MAFIQPATVLPEQRQSCLFHFLLDDWSPSGLLGQKRQRAGRTPRRWREGLRPTCTRSVWKCGGPLPWARRSRPAQKSSPSPKSSSASRRGLSLILRLDYSTTMAFIQSATVLPEQRQQVSCAWFKKDYLQWTVLVHHDGGQRTARPTLATCF